MLFDAPSPLTVGTFVDRLVSVAVSKRLFSRIDLFEKGRR